MVNLTIIIPIFNCEKTITNCIESIRHQTYHNWNLLLIDDGSTDNTKNLCLRQVSLDKRIHYFFQENQGVSKARNHGLMIANTEYVMFVDADDYLKPSICEKLTTSITPFFELAVCGFNRRFYYATNTYRSVSVLPKCAVPINQKNYGKYFGKLYENTIFTSPCFKLYRIEIIKKFHLHFDESLDLAEDVLFNIQYHQHVTNISIINEPLYIYNHFRNPLSLSKTKNTERLLISKYIFHTVKNFCMEKNIIEENLPFILNVFYKDCFNFLENFIGLELFHQIKKLLADDITDILLSHRVFQKKSLIIYYYLFKMNNALLLWIFIYIRKAAKYFLRGQV